MTNPIISPNVVVVVVVVAVVAVVVDAAVVLVDVVLIRGGDSDFASTSLDLDDSARVDVVDDVKDRPRRGNVAAER